ncbi:uncharacterized protein LOC116444729 [Corvus moneduloides]|uniref:uncharacterized protein LOC116444729 n=1 Tax=Corvus moneduloides TaxID=1196302 RepID=UPI00136455E4|nr:uncharacterized protein LOC116444729 [Corvus moneduloides]
MANKEYQNLKKKNPRRLELDKLLDRPNLMTIRKRYIGSRTFCATFRSSQQSESSPAAPDSAHTSRILTHPGYRRYARHFQLPAPGPSQHPQALPSRPAPMPRRAPNSGPADLVAANGAGERAMTRRLCRPNHSLPEAGEAVPARRRPGAAGCVGRRALVKAPPLPRTRRRLLGERITRPALCEGRGPHSPPPPHGFPAVPDLPPSPLPAPGRPAPLHQRGLAAATTGKGRGRGSAPREGQEKAAHPAPEGRSPGLAPPPPPAATCGARAPRTSVSPSDSGGAARPRFARRGGIGPAEPLRALLPQPPPPSWPPLRRGHGGRSLAEGYRQTDTHRYLVTPARPGPSALRAPRPTQAAGRLRIPCATAGALGERAGCEETPTPSVHCARDGWRPRGRRQCLLGVVVFPTGPRPAPPRPVRDWGVSAAVLRTVGNRGAYFSYKIKYENSDELCKCFCLVGRRVKSRRNPKRGQGSDLALVWSSIDYSVPVGLWRVLLLDLWHGVYASRFFVLSFGRKNITRGFGV